MKIEVEVANCHECPFIINHEDKEYYTKFYYCKLLYNNSDSFFHFDAQIDEDTIILDNCPFIKKTL